MRCNEDLLDEFEEVKERGGYKDKTTAGADLLERGIESWRREHLHYPGDEFISHGTRVAALAVIIGSPVSIALKDGMAYQSVGVLAATMLAFLVAHGLGLAWARWQQ